MRSIPKQYSTKRMLIRQLSIGDAAAWKRFNNRIARKQPWAEVPSIVYARNEILHYQEQWDKQTRFAYAIIEKSTGKCIGDLHLKNKSIARRRVEVGYALDPEHWGRGIMPEVLTRLREKLAGWRIIAKVEPENTKSITLLRRLGAKFKGRRAVHIDGGVRVCQIYQL